MNAERDTGGGYTLDPDEFESTRTVGRSPIYSEEAGIKPALRSEPILHACDACGMQVLLGALANGTHVLVEPQTAIYTLIWHNRAPLPTLILGRGYPAHRCTWERQEKAAASIATGEAGESVQVHATGEAGEASR